jgi:hypothetical protein
MTNPTKTAFIQVITHHQKSLSLFILLLFVPALAVYDLPSSRAIPWLCGSDLWNKGVLPDYAQITCSPLYGDNVNDDAARIQNGINAAAANTAVYLPAGTYYVNGAITLKSNVVLRGAGASGTILRLGPNGHITTSGANKSSACNFMGTPQKGDTLLTLQTSSQANAGDWISIFSDDDPLLVTATGANGVCTWCGEGGNNCIQQIVKVVAKNGSVITISKPLYYTLFTNPRFKRYTFGTQYAGVENLKLWGAVDIGTYPMILLNGCLYCWARGVETDSAGSQNSASHCILQWSYGCEVRDSYFHDAYSSAGGVNYGVHFYFVNSDHKVENNIFRHNRHSVVFEGGGAGCAVLYNYIDDNYTNDLTYLGNSCYNHGAHPYMNLFEGNIISHIVADDTWGSSSHCVVFRNWLWGDETGTGVPGFPPNSGYVAIDVFDKNSYYSFVGNVLGILGKHTNWSNATLRPAALSPYPSYSAPVVYNYAPSISTTSLNHGNYDYKTNGVAYWEGGSDHVLKNSLYYSSAPAWWCSEIPWPAIGPDVGAIHNDIPAKRRYEGLACNGASVERSVPMATLRPYIATHEVFDIKGRLVMIFKGDRSGENGLTGRSARERNLSRGIYLCRISAGGVTIAEKHVMVR